MKTYRIKPKHLDRWGDCDETTRVTDDDIARLASEWGVDVASLMDQVTLADSEDGAMKTYYFQSDGESGTVQAESLEAALAAARAEAGVTDEALADGGWCWVEDQETGVRLHSESELPGARYAVLVRSTTGEWTRHSVWPSREEAQDQADYVGGRVVAQ